MAKIFSNGKFKRLLPYFLFAVAVIAAYEIITGLGYIASFFGTLWGLIAPFFYGFLLAYIINIPLGGFKRLLNKPKNKIIRKIKNPLSVILTILVFALIIFAVLILVIPYIVQSITFFISQLPVYYEAVRDAINYINSLGIRGIHISSEAILSMIYDFIQNLNLDNLTTTLNAMFGVGTALFTIILSFIASIYILAEKEKFKRFLRKFLTVFFSGDVCKAIYEYTGSLNNNFKRYIRVQTIDGCILGTLATIQLLILGSPYALLFGLMLGIVNYIPYFGSIFGTIVVVLIVVFTQGLTIGLIAAVTLLITQQIDGNIIQPKLMGGSFSLSPLLVIISIVFGGAAAGILGMIAAIPIIAVLKDILYNIIEYHQRKKLQTASLTAGLPENPDESTVDGAQ